jgi:hypothetical protein
VGYNARNDEIRDNITRMRREWEAQRGALATVRRFNATLSAKGYSGCGAFLLSQSIAVSDQDIEPCSRHAFLPWRLTALFPPANPAAEYRHRSDPIKVCLRYWPERR